MISQAKTKQYGEQENMKPKRGYDFFLDLVHRRKQTYEFAQKQVTDADLKKILDAARWAPSCNNAQPWRFIIVRDKKTIAALLEKGTQHLFAPFLHPYPPLVVAFILDTACLSKEKLVCSENPRQKVADAYLCLAMCINHAILGAASLGINTCILTPNKPEVGRILKTNAVIPLLVGFGYEAKGAFQRIRTRARLKKLIMKTL